MTATVGSLVFPLYFVIGDAAALFERWVRKGQSMLWRPTER
jgi:hypothetical protein